MVLTPETRLRALVLRVRLWGKLGRPAMQVRYWPITDRRIKRYLRKAKGPGLTTGAFDASITNSKPRAS